MRRFVVIDVGNTSTAVGLWSAGRVTNISHCDGGFEEVRAVVQGLLKKFLAVEALAYLSVVPRADGVWQKFARAAKIPFLPLTYRLFPKHAAGPGGLRIDYPKPETIGADRLADAVAAVTRYGAPVIVCDFGTAFTAAAITRDFSWRGGVIAPGFPLMRDYLYERTANLPRMKLGGKCPKIGRSTEEAMRFGALVGYRGMVREIVTQLEKNFKTPFKRVATGGFAKWVLAGAGMDFTIDPDLTLYGAGVLACNEE